MTIRDAKSNGKNAEELIAASIKSITIVAFVRSYEARLRDKQSTRFVVVNAHKIQQDMKPDSGQASSKQPTALVPETPSPKQKQKRNQPGAVTSTTPETSEVGSQKPPKRMK